jgi:lysophospholipase L1-like esterase
MGWGVEQDLTLTADLERRLNANPPAGFPSNVRYEVLNLGVGNYNTVQEVTLLKSVGLQLDPDMILLCYFINDAEPVTKSYDSYLIEHSYLYAFLASRLRRSPFGQTGSLGYQEYYRGLYASDQPGWRAEKAAFQELAELARAKNIPVVVYLLPELHELTAYPFLDIHQMVAKVGAAAGLPVVDLLPEFSGYSPEVKLWVTPADAHPNALANTMIARGIYNSLSSVREGGEMTDSGRTPDQENPTR